MVAEQIFVDRPEGDWVALDWLPGVRMLALAQPVAGGFIHRLRLAAGTEIPVHTHPSDEYVYVIEGDVTGERGLPGGNVLAHPGWGVPGTTSCVE